MNGGQALYRILVAQIDCAEGLSWHRLDPVGNAQVRRYRGRQLSIEFRRAAEFERQRFKLVVHGSFFIWLDTAFLSGLPHTECGLV